MGFTEEQVKNALALCDNDKDDAMDYLLVAPETQNNEQ